MTSSARHLVLAAGTVAIAVSVFVSAYYRRMGEDLLYPAQILRVVVPLVLVAIALTGRRWAAWLLAGLCVFWTLLFGAPAVPAAIRGLEGAARWVGVAAGYALAAALAVLGALRSGRAEAGGA